MAATPRPPSRTAVCPPAALTPAMLLLGLLATATPKLRPAGAPPSTVDQTAATSCPAAGPCVAATGAPTAAPALPAAAAPSLSARSAAPAPPPQILRTLLPSSPPCPAPAAPPCAAPAWWSHCAAGAAASATPASPAAAALTWPASAAPAPAAADFPTPPRPSAPLRLGTHPGHSPSACRSQVEPTAVPVRSERGGESCSRGEAGRAIHRGCRPGHMCRCASSRCFTSVACGRGPCRCDHGSTGGGSSGT
jgi:hypothetical protein